MTLPITLNMIYPAARKNMLSGNIPNLGLQTTTVYCALMSASYLVPNTASDDQYFAEAGPSPTYANVCTMVGGLAEVELTGKQITGWPTSAGIYAVAPSFPVALSSSVGSVTFPNVDNGQQATSVVTFLSSSNPMTDDYLLSIHVSSSAGAAINITTNGGDVTINWATGPTGSAGIFGLSCT